MKRVELRVRQLMARRAFKAGTFEARLGYVAKESTKDCQSGTQEAST